MSTRKKCSPKDAKLPKCIRHEYGAISPVIMRKVESMYHSSVSKTKTSKTKAKGSPKKVRKPINSKKPVNRWLKHVEKVRKETGLKGKEVFKVAAKTYKKQSKKSLKK